MGHSKYARKLAEGLSKVGSCAALLMLLEQALKQQLLEDSLVDMPLFSVSHLLLLPQIAPTPLGKVLLALSCTRMAVHSNLAFWASMQKT